MAFLDQTVDFFERVATAPPRPEAVARRVERRLEDRFDHQLQRRLRDAVFNHRDTQRPRPAIAFRDLHPSDRLRPVTARPQRRCELGQIDVRPRREPFEALPIHARRALVGPNLRPGRHQRCRRVHLIHQTVPPSSCDAVDQRRHHAFRPHRSFHPGPVPSFCTTFSLTGTAGARLLPCGHRASTFLPPFPRPGFALPASRGLHRRGTMRALTPDGLATSRQVSPLTPLCLPDIPSPTT